MTRAPVSTVTGSAGPFAATTPDGSRLHLQHGPIDLVVEAFGAPEEVAEAYRRAWDRFRSVLDELVEELPALRRPLCGSAFEGSVARRMAVAVEPFADVFVTPMAAVAGAVADEICAELTTCELERAYVNDGGDIALWLTPGTSFSVGLVPVPDRPSLLGSTTVRASDPVRGVATSGRHGRSFSLGIADAVSVLAETAARADVAATLLANAVDLPGHSAVGRAPAVEIAPDTDLGDRLVTVRLGALTDAEVAEALEAGVREASRMRAAGLLEAAVLCLNGQVAVVGPVIASGAGGTAIPATAAIPKKVWRAAEGRGR